ncbi:hypothetical protein Ahia01_001167900, partial [Argonauta hians]
DNAVEVKKCNTEEFCCTYSPWSFWSACSTSCGPGTRTRHRETMDKDNCDADPVKERRTCEVEPCDVDCGKWSAWSSCTGDCNLGSRYRQFEVANST